MNVGNVVITTLVTKKLSAKSTPVVLIDRAEVKEIVMSNNEGEVSFSLGATIPGIFGQYSSMSVTIGMKVPSDTLKIKDQKQLAAALEARQDAVTAHLMQTVNETCVLVGKDKVFPE